MRIGRAGWVAGALALLASPAMAKDEFPNDVAAYEKAIKLEPFSPWNIDFGESRCRLSRLFGDEKEPHLLFIEQGAPLSTFAITLAGPELDRFHRSKNIWIGMERDEPLVRDERAGSAEVGEFGKALIFNGFSINGDPSEGDPDEDVELPTVPIMAGIDPLEASTIDRTVIKRGTLILSFETGNMKAPMEALNTCTGDLLIRWGLKPEEHFAYIPPRWTNAQEVVRRIQRAYPYQALREGESGIFRLRVIVEKDGTVSNCQIENATITKSLESPACGEMKRAKFEPARNVDGKPIRSFHASTITYVVN